MEHDLVTKKTEETVDPWQDATQGDALVLHTEDPNRDFLTVTLKAGTGFDAPWLVFHANSVDEALESLQHDKLDELMDLTARKSKALAAAFGGSQGFSKAPTSTGWSKPAQAVSQPAGDRPTGTCPVHNCDLAYQDAFKKRDGSEISARVACPVPKCYAKTFWLNKDGSWTEK